MSNIQKALDKERLAYESQGRFNRDVKDKLSRAVIEAAVRLLDTEEWEDTGSRDALDLALAAWADHVNGEEP